MVGAGPAGLSAAAALAGAGREVIVLEKDRLPRYKPCGGGVVMRARRLLPTDPPMAYERLCYEAELNLTDPGLSLRVRREDPLASLTMRADFDLWLAEQARRKGARVQDGCRVRQLDWTREEVEVVTNRGPYLSRFVLGADGALSTVARSAGFRNPTRLIPALASEVRVDDDVLARFRERLRFDYGPVSRGYAWMFPKREHLSVGVVGWPPADIGMSGVLKQYLALLGIGKWVESASRGFVVPAAPRKGSPVRRRVLLAGDALGVGDPITFEGISQAVLSGQLAARALLEGGFREADVRAGYEKLLSKHILQELAWGRRFAALFYGSARRRNWVFRHYGPQLTEAMADVMMGTRSYRDTVKRVPAMLWSSPRSRRPDPAG